VVELNRTGHGHIILRKDGKESDLKAFDLPPGFSLDASHTVDFRAQGDLLTVDLDGKRMAETRDGTQPNGLLLVLGAAGTIFEKAEYKDLTSTSPPAP
jgi:hypothetical protein